MQRRGTRRKGATASSVTRKPVIREKKTLFSDVQVPVNAVAMLMLMLTQVNAFRSSHYQTLNTPQCTQSRSI